MPGRKGIAPHIFQPEMLPGFLMHDVDYYVYIVHYHPLQGLKSFFMVYIFSGSIFYLILYGICYGFYLCSTASRADNEEISYGFRNIFQVETNNISPFLILNGFDDKFE